MLSRWQCSYGSSGNLYGTTTLCGTSNAGTVWELSPNGSGGYNENILYNFTGGVDGSTPDAGVVLDSAGNLYGVTISGGDSSGDGVLYEVSPSGTQTVLHTFSSATDGSTPIGGVLVGADGNLYGTRALAAATASERSGVITCITRSTLPWQALVPVILPAVRLESTVQAHALRCSHRRQS